MSAKKIFIRRRSDLNEFLRNGEILVKLLAEQNNYILRPKGYKKINNI